MPYVDLPGVHLWYTDTGGTGVPVIFLHAASGNTDAWASQIPAFSAAGYRCIAYDRRGWGKSTPAGPDQPGSAADDLNALVDHLGLDRFHLVGTAAGGGPSLDYTLSFPDRVRSLTLADAGTGASTAPDYVQMRENYRPAEIDALPVECRELSAGYRATNPDGVKRWLEIDHNSRQKDWTQNQRPRNTITYPLLEAMKAPVLIVCGDADLVTPPALMRLAAAHIPGCRFELIPEAGHGSHWEQPDVWNRLVLDFIRTH